MKITVHHIQTELLGKKIVVGAEAPAARVTKLNNDEKVIGMMSNTTQLLISIPSLKTEVCSLGAKKFNNLIAKYKKLSTIIITTDESEYIQEFVQKENIHNLDIVRDTHKNFAKKYGLLISDGKLKDKLARSVFVINTEGIVTYKEIVSEIVNEIDYETCLSAVDTSVNLLTSEDVYESCMSSCTF